MLLFSALLLGWLAFPVTAGKMDDLQAKLAKAKGQKRIKILEQIYNLSVETEDLEYQLNCLNNLLAESRKQKNRVAEVNALCDRAVFFYNNDLNDSVLIAVRRDMERVKELESWPIYFQMWGMIANTYVYLGQNSMGIRETQAMYEDAKERGDTLGMGQANCIMGTAYSNLRNFDLSVEVFEKSLTALSQMNTSPSIMPDVYAYYGNALNDMKDFVKLERLTEKWSVFLKDFFAQHHLDGTPASDIYLAYYHLACVQAALGLSKYDVAEQHLHDARKHINDMDNQLGSKWFYNSAQLYLMQGKYMDALEMNTYRMQQPDMGDKAVRIVACQQRAEIFEEMGRYAAAVALYKEIHNLTDSLNTQETKGQLNEMNTIFHVDELKMKQAEEQARLEAEKARQQKFGIIVIASIIVVSLGIFLYFRIRSAKRLKIAHQKLEDAHGKLETAHQELLTAYDQLEETTAAKERIESDLRIARNIQMGMVPRNFPEREDLDLYASMTPAKEVGGDLYGYVLMEDKLYFALGDVSGKGVPASLFMAQATRLFRTLAAQELMPADIATQINEALSGEDNETSMFVTMFLGLIDLRTGHLDFCNAGHNPPVLLKDGKAEFIEMIPNAPIGLWPGLPYEGAAIANITNQPLFVYTDGLNEAENRQQQQFTDERLLEIMETHPFESCQQTVELLRDEVEKHRDGAEPNDDLTMICVKVVKENN